MSCVNMEKICKLSDFEPTMFAGSRWARLSIKIKSTDLLEYPRTTFSGVYREWTGKSKNACEQQFCRQKSYINDRS